MSNYKVFILVTIFLVTSKIYSQKKQEKLYNKAKTEALENNFEKAIHYLNKITKKDNKQIQAFELKGYFYSQLNNDSLSLFNYKKAIEIEFENSELCNNIALSYYGNQEYQKAITYLSNFILNSRNNSYQFYLRGLCYLNLEDNRKAINDFNIAIKNEISNELKALYYTSRGIAYYNLNEIDNSIKDYTYSISLDSLNTDNYINRGVAFRLKKQFYKALEDYEQALSLDPSDYLIYHNIGVVKIWLKDFEGALNYENKSLELNAQNSDALVNKGQCLLN